MKHSSPHLRSISWLVAAILPIAALALQPGPVKELPSGILAVAPAEIGPRHVLVAEKSTQTLYVYGFDSHQATLERVYPCTTGKVKGDKRVEGDLKTPEGVYWFCRRIGGDELPPLYGAGAFVMDYPNQFDRRDGKTGSGIWLHGVETNDRVYVANDTRGCVAIRNDHFADLRKLVRLHDTPILVVESLEFKDAREVAREGHFIGDLVEGWRRAWEARDFEAYMAFYSDDFNVGGLGREAWERHKREVARLEGERQVAIDDMTILREKDRVWVTFRQEYASSTHQDVGVKTLFLQGKGDAWRIVGEAWREIDEPFRLLHPTGPAPQSLVASAERPRPLLTPEEQEDAIAASAAARADEVAASAPPEGAESDLVVPPIVPAAQAPAEVAAATSEEETASLSASLAPPAPAAPEPAAAVTPPPPAAPAVARVVARAATARIAKGPFRLSAPWTRAEGETIVVAMQLISSTPSTSRSGVLVLKRKSDARPEHEIGRERFTVRQGRDIEARLARTDLPSDVVVLVLDESGKVLLDQDIAVAVETTP